MTADLTARVKEFAREIGFDDCRIAAAGEAPHAAEFRQWLAEGRHGDMAWLARNPARRCDPREVLPGCRSVVSVALNYFAGVEGAGATAVGNSVAPHAQRTEAHAPGGGPPYRIARYALNEDYHFVIESMLDALDQAMRQLGGNQRRYVDTGPLLERDFASTAGLGWNGKSTVQIHRRLGTWFFLAEILTTLDLTSEAPSADYCGKCTRCIDACPTGAITSPHRLDARRCIAYLTIEHQRPIPEEFRRAIGDRIFGCDDCLEACPWNRFAQVSRDLRFQPRAAIFHHSPRDFLTLDEAAFRALFARSPIKRLRLPRFLRNVCVALGNIGTAADLAALTRAAAHPDPLVAEHAIWAAGEIRRRGGTRQCPG